ALLSARYSSSRERRPRHPRATYLLRGRNRQLRHRQGELAGVRLSKGERQYLRGIYAAYDGTGGVPMGGIARRILFAWHFNDVNLLLSSYITGDSRIMIRRNMQER